MKPSLSATNHGARVSRRAVRAWLSVLLTSAVALASACGIAVDDSGSNSNWLFSCVDDAECDSGLTCMCGQCTTACTESAACTDLGGRCVLPESTCGVPMSGMCVAECGSNAQCEAIHPDLRCVSGTCRELTQVLPIEPEGGTPGMISLPPGDWTSRGTPAACDFGAVTIDVPGTAPWGEFNLSETWVGYTTGSTRPEFMTIAFRGTWSDGPIIVGVSISKTPESGAELVSDDGMEVFVTRYVDSYSEQVEVQGTLTVDEYVAPEDPFADGGLLTLRGQLDLESEGWSLSAPFDIPSLCYYAPIIVK